MKVLLLAKVRELGEIGSAVEVSSGYALNFLFPRGLAEPLTIKNQREIATRQKEKQNATIERELRWKSILREVERITLTIKAEKNNQGTLFAALKADKIYQALLGIGIDIEDSYYVIVNQPIKAVGEYLAAIVFTAKLKCRLRIKVI